jgi:hypothetical protein
MVEVLHKVFVENLIASGNDSASLAENGYFR